MQHGRKNGVGGLRQLDPLRANRSLIDKVYDRLVDAIATNELPPGERLTQHSLATRLAVSRQPISHALHRLKAAGLAVNAGKRGLVVAATDANRLRDIYQVRVAFDGLAARLAAERVASKTAPAKDLRSLKHVLLSGKRLSHEQSRAEWVAADVAFHNAMYRLADNTVIIETIFPLWTHLRRSMGAVPNPKRRPLVWSEHQAIADAIFAGRASTAERLARKHVEGAATVALKMLAEGDPEAKPAPRRPLAQV